jgi:membrane fusion protein (multidrug efflux system)
MSTVKQPPASAPPASAPPATQPPATQPPATQPPPKRIRNIAYLVIVIIAVLICIKLFVGSGNESTNDAYVTADFTLVAPRVPGQILEVLVEDNQHVSAGQLLVRIDDRDYRAALMSAQANVESGNASVANYDAEIARQPSLVGQARATLRADQATLEFARLNASRYSTLSETGAGTTQEQQHASSALAEQIAQQSRDQAVLVATDENLNVLRSLRDKAVGDLARAHAELEQAKLNLSYTEIHAPVDGKVGRRSVRVGAYVTTGSSLLAIVPLAKAYVLSNYQENQLTYMRVGDPVSIKIDTFPGVVIHGHINSLAPATGESFAPIAPDNATGNFTKIVQRVPVKITIDPGQHVASALSVGLSVETEVDVGNRHDTKTRIAGADEK